MRKWITLLMTCLVAGSLSYANANVGQVDFEAGYRRDNISWKLRVPSHDPKISTDSKFKDLDIFQIGLNGRTTLGCNFYLRANAYWGWILDGTFKNHVSTNASDEYNSGLNHGFTDRARTTIDDQYVYGVGAAIGYPFYFCDCTTIIAPVIGYSFDQQNVRVENGSFSNNFAGFGDSCYNDYYGNNSSEDGCCRQTFHSKWYGPFVGVDFNYRPYNQCWNFYADFEFHWGDFRGDRGGFDGIDVDRSNRKSHNANGWVFAAGADYDLCECWTVGFSVKFQDWTASRHHRNSYYSSDDCCGSSRARESNKWNSYAINLTIGRDF